MIREMEKSWMMPRFLASWGGDGRVTTLVLGTLILGGLRDIQWEMPCRSLGLQHATAVYSQFPSLIRTILDDAGTPDNMPWVCSLSTFAHVLPLLSPFFLAFTNPSHLSSPGSNLPFCIRFHPSTTARIHISAALRVSMKLLSNLTFHCLVRVSLYYTDV